MVTTNELKANQFIQGLKQTIVRDLKSGGIKGVPFAEIADRTLVAKQAEKDILDEKKVIRERHAREAQQNFRPGYQGGKRRTDSGATSLGCKKEDDSISADIA